MGDRVPFSPDMPESNSVVLPPCDHTLPFVKVNSPGSQGVRDKNENIGKASQHHPKSPEDTFLDTVDNHSSELPCLTEPGLLLFSKRASLNALFSALLGC